MSESITSTPILVKSLPTNSPSFLECAVKVCEGSIWWKSANSEGKLDLLEIFKDMEKERGFLVADEAYENLPRHMKSLVNPDQLIQLTANSSSLFIEFEKWTVFEKWVNGNTYIEMLVILNGIDDAGSLHQTRDSIMEKAWVYDIDYQLLSEDIVKYKVAFQEYSKNISIVQCEKFYEDMDVPETVCEIFSKYSQYVDTVNYKLVEVFILNSLREILATNLSKDVITPKKKGVKFESPDPVNKVKEYEQWYMSIESSYKAEQMSAHLRCLAENNDPIIQLFRILEVQKLSFQISLSCIYSNAEVADDDYHKVEARLENLRKYREDINNSIRENNRPGARKQRDFCNLDCECRLL